MYTVVVETTVIKQLRKIPEPFHSRIENALKALSVDPRPKGYLKLKGREGYRIRVGDYSVIYEIKDQQLFVLVITIAHRKDVYE